MNCNQLFLPFSPDCLHGITISFNGKREKFLGSKLGDMLRLSLTAGKKADLIFSSEYAEGRSILRQIYGEFDILETAENLYIRQLPREQQVRCNGLLTMKQMLPCAVRQSWKNGMKATLFHGAMLTHPEYPEQCVLIFGISGMGKSTTAKRWKIVGGNAPADDLIFIYQDKNGDFFARPLPTWSRYPEAVDFNICRKVINIFHLQRGRQDEIVAVKDKSAWSVDCVKSLMFHYYLPNLRQEISGTIAFECMTFGEALRKKFDAYDLNTHLDGDLYPILIKCFEP